MLMQRKSSCSPTLLPMSLSFEPSSGRINTASPPLPPFNGRCQSPTISVSSIKRHLSSGSYSSISSQKSAQSTASLNNNNASSSSSTSSLKNKSRAFGEGGSWSTKFLVVCLMGIMFVIGCKITQQRNTVIIQGMEKEKDLLVGSKDQLQIKFNNLVDAGRSTSSQLHAAQERITEYERMEQDPKRMEEQRAYNQIKQIQSTAKEEAVQLFGKGPHYVEFTLHFPNNGKKQEHFYKYFTVEMASLDVMPTSVLMFLKQVKYETWDNGTFSYGEVHVNMARPENGDKIRQMVDHGMATTPYAEYGVDHTPYTMGFAGFPAGPEFYINKIDNTDSHGPGGHQHDGGRYEPVFGTIIIGRDVVDEMNALPVENTNDSVQIVSVRQHSTIESVHGGQEWLTQQ